jgi:hypothetical protein
LWAVERWNARTVERHCDSTAVSFHRFTVQTFHR